MRYSVQRVRVPKRIGFRVWIQFVGVVNLSFRVEVCGGLRDLRDSEPPSPRNDCCRATEKGMMDCMPLSFNDVKVQGLGSRGLR